MDPILAALPESLLAFVEDQLSNNDLSSDEELQEHFIASGLSEEQAGHALTYRDHYRRDLYLKGFTPIRTPDAALRFNPHTRDFEPDSYHPTGQCLPHRQCCLATEDMTMPASSSTAPLFATDECPELMADACVGDDQGTLVFASL